MAENKIPQHIGIILDGNRRFAKKLMMQPWKGHEWGAEKIEKLLGWCDDIGVRELTLYAFSMQNFNRPKDEFDYLMTVFSNSFEKLIAKKEEIASRNLRITFIGRIHLFPPEVHQKMLQLMEMTSGNSGPRVNFAMAYGGREEIIDAVKKIGRKIEAGEISDSQITEDLIDAHLYSDHSPDFIIRTGGDHRTSNFLIWQSWYSEWFFLEKTWPEFEKEDLLMCIEQYQNRERRFGK
jgi:tritrans,polycis-undecaprenyl-diphosphate synthase [geranylgeranyl-diphosphate specific]